MGDVWVVLEDVCFLWEMELEKRDLVIIIVSVFLGALSYKYLLSNNNNNKQIIATKNSQINQNEEEKEKEEKEGEEEDDEEDEEEEEDYFSPTYKIKDDYNLLSGRFKMVISLSFIFLIFHNISQYFFPSFFNFIYNCKVLCVNMNLQMGKGKIAAQCGHATLGAYRIAKRYCKTAIKSWLYFGQAKIALKV